MAGHSRAELERAFAHYCELRERACTSGDWSVWAAQFSDDALYVEHAYGEMHGRDAITRWICDVMAPFPQMTFPIDWVMYDEPRGWVLFQCQNRLPHPSQPGGPPFQFQTWSRLAYAGELFWSHHEDVYNPKVAADTIQAWIAAGGRLAIRERVKMTRG